MFARHGNTARHASLLRQGLVVCVALACLGEIALPTAEAQFRIIAPPRRAATALGDLIYARADATRALGSFLVDQGVARNLHAEAASKEMDNYLKWVDTYFQARILNRQYRDQLNPGYADSRRGNYDRRKKEILETPSFVLANKPVTAEDLNWMLRELISDSEAVSIAYRNDPNYLIPLSKEALSHIRLTDGGLANGEALVFRAGDGEVLEVSWPYVLRAPDFDSERAAFEALRDEVLALLKQGEPVPFELTERWMQSIDALSAKLASKYSADWKPESFAEHQRVGQAEEYLAGLALQTYRALATGDRGALNGNLRFQGESLSELMVHMLEKGLEFAPPEPGAEGSYRHVWLGMLRIFEEVNRDFETKEEQEDDQQAEPARIEPRILGPEA
jgi:hypothetical protein